MMTEIILLAVAIIIAGLAYWCGRTDGLAKGKRIMFKRATKWHIARTSLTKEFVEALAGNDTCLLNEKETLYPSKYKNVVDLYEEEA